MSISNERRLVTVLFVDMVGFDRPDRVERRSAGSMAFDLTDATAGS